MYAQLSFYACTIQKVPHRGFGIHSSGMNVALVASARLSVSMSTDRAKAAYGSCPLDTVGD